MIAYITIYLGCVCISYLLSYGYRMFRHSNCHMQTRNLQIPSKRYFEFVAAWKLMKTIKKITYFFLCKTKIGHKL